VKASTTFNDPESGQPPQTEKQLDSDQNNNPNFAQKIKFQDFPDIPAPQPEGNFFYNLLFGLLSWEGRINFFGGLFFSAANNYLKWWDYNPGLYCNLRIGCLGLKSKRLLNGMLQFEGNLNLIRGVLWLIPGIFELIQYVKEQDNPRKSTACLIMLKILGKVKGNEPKFGFFYSIFFLVQGFVSIPLTLHFSKFSISISLDSIIWGVAGMILENKVVTGAPIEGAKEKDNQNDKNIEIDDIEYKNKLNEETDKNDIKDEFKKDDE
jgi:hypothetical protein